MSFDLADFRYQYADSGCISRLPLTLCNDATNATTTTQGTKLFVSEPQLKSLATYPKIHFSGIISIMKVQYYDNFIQKPFKMVLLRQCCNIVHQICIAIKLIKQYLSLKVNMNHNKPKDSQALLRHRKGYLQKDENTLTPRSILVTLWVSTKLIYPSYHSTYSLVTIIGCNQTQGKS